MNQLQNRSFTAEEIFIGENLRVIKSRPAFEYVDGVKTDKRVATFVTVVDLESFDKYDIKMEIGNEVREHKTIHIDDLIGFRGSLYVRNGKIFWSLKANHIGDSNE